MWWHHLYVSSCALVHLCIQLEQERLETNLARYRDAERDELEKRQRLFEEQQEAELRLQEEERDKELAETKAMIKRGEVKEAVGVGEVIGLVGVQGGSEVKVEKEKDGQTSRINNS